MRAPRRAAARLALVAAMLPGGAAGQDAGLLILAPGMRAGDPGALPIDAERIEAGIAAARGPLTDLSGALGRLPSGHAAALVTMSDGQLIVMRRHGGATTATPIGGLTGPLPLSGAVEGVPATPGIADVLPVQVDDDPQANTGEEVGPFRLSRVDAAGLAGLARRGASTLAPCGVGVAARDHCALPTVELRETGRASFCTGVLISEAHILTAAHCLCTRIDDSGALEVDLEARMGAGGTWTILDIADAPPNLFTPVVGGACATGINKKAALRHGDLALLSLAPGAFDGARADLGARGVSTQALSRMIAPLAEEDEAIWRVPDAVPNVFATWGFGTGPDGAVGRKRALDYPLRDLGRCLLPPAGLVSEDGAICEGLQEANFHDPENGLCFGDSGGGVFKPVDGPPPAGAAPWALMGIVAGTSESGRCFDAEAMLLETHHERNVVRLDTPLVRAWIDAAAAEAGAELRVAPVRESIAPTIAEN